MLTEEKAEDFLEEVTGDATPVLLRVAEDNLIPRIDVTILMGKEIEAEAEAN